MACATCASDGGCGCITNFKEQSLGGRTLWTLGGANPGIVNVFFGGDDGLAISPTIALMQLTLTVKDASLDFDAAVGFQVSADRNTWGSEVWFGTSPAPSQPFFQVGNGVLCYPWYTPNINLMRYIRFVVRAQQHAGGALAVANVALSLGLIIR